MTKQELTELVQDAQNAGAGCGCCASWPEAYKEREEVVEKIWKEVKQRIEDETTFTTFQSAFEEMKTLYEEFKEKHPYRMWWEEFKLSISEWIHGNIINPTKRSWTYWMDWLDNR